MKAESLSSLPRQTQASKFKSAQRENTEKDELWAIANMSKEEAEEGILLSGLRTVALAMCFWQMTGNWMTFDAFVQTLSVLESWALTLSSTVVIFMLHQPRISISAAGGQENNEVSDNAGSCCYSQTFKYRMLQLPCSIDDKGSTSIKKHPVNRKRW